MAIPPTRALMNLPDWMWGGRPVAPERAGRHDDTRVPLQKIVETYSADTDPSTLDIVAHAREHLN